ncbi:copper resistance CopC family protein [Naasia sp. SYSU D00057]|uniref:copper resistance CopC family protein n=1 Tax=Naasia sp. SYSU D00057 TaxID=2817380 RepID=UPI001B30E66D|nr:copper resistance CopC family protein [Naasia sp. SYSU D00057]
MRRNPLRLVAALGLGAALAVAAPLAASAHDSLTSSSPAADSTVEVADAVSLTFSNVVLALGEDQRSTAIQVRQEDRYYETECPTIEGRNVSTPVALGGAGEYEVVWQVVSSDGHPTSGSYTFAYTPAAGAAEADGSAEPACGSAAAAPAEGGDDAILLGAAAGVVLLAVAGVLAAVLLGRRSGARRE